MAGQTNVAIAAAAIAISMILLATPPASGEKRRQYCGIELARAVVVKCSQAKRSGNTVTNGVDVDALWSDEHPSNRNLPSLGELLLATRFRRSSSIFDSMPMARYCCSYGCSERELASVC
ncbi:uncharacterized protein [Diadema setosum]|uniref:uncharacterized protein n=1 Tax=Diadema setosum TaxID=31175 RepID=UPI003B3A9F53